MRCIFLTVASLLLTAATAPVLAQQSSLTMVRNVSKNGFSPDSTGLSLGPVHFLRGSDAVPEISQRNGFSGFGPAYDPHVQPVHFLMPYSHVFGSFIVKPLSSQELRELAAEKQRRQQSISFGPTEHIREVGAARHHKPGR